ncbi:hypothetical protein QUG92_15835 [Curtobacterium sp. RHCKG23]|uniref:Uncharacterized protein n=1 Tax=Curtobacterium citri TaxID=3055139 RepID=A0ABT7TAH8_9MICO|nr:hypothetical protein [Curtobacterium citri]MDM7886582.1 hypothetical protein [Curtobacterium citri]
MVEIGVFSGVLCLLTVVLASLDPHVQRLGWAGVPTWFSSAGTVLAAHIGWYYGALIPLLLGFYAFIGGGQLLGVPHVQRSRRNLGLVAELLTGATWPPFLILLCSAAVHADQRALIIVLVPVQAVVLFLGAQLGGFIVFDRDERHRAAIANAEAARKTLTELRNRSRYPAWRILLMHALVVGVVSWLAVVAVSPAKPILLMWPLLVALILLAVGVGAVFIGAIWFFLAATDRVTRFLAWWVPYGIVLVLVLLALSQPFSRVAIAVDAALAVQLVSAVLGTHVRSSRRWWRNWSLSGGGRRSAAREVVRRYASAMREAHSTRPTLVATRTFASEVRRWIRGGFRSFRAR